MRNIYDYIKDPILRKELEGYEHIDNVSERNAFSEKVKKYISNLPKEQQDAHNRQLVQDVNNILHMVDDDINDIKREKNRDRGRKIASITL